MKAGVVALAGRPNVGKSTLLNRIIGTKVSIVSDKPQTTRWPVRGVLNRLDAQAVFVDTPGIHKPRTLLGTRLNDAAAAGVADVDVVVLVTDVAGFGRGDLLVASRLPADSVVVVNKIDRANRAQVLTQLAAAGELGAGHEYFPISARTGRGVSELVDHLITRLPEGEPLFPADVVSDVADSDWVAELVREQLLAIAREELPHSLACRVTDWEWPYIRCEIVVERESQKGIVIGKGGHVLKEVGSRVRAEVGAEAWIELVVRVVKDWQRRPEALDRLGLPGQPGQFMP